MLVSPLQSVVYALSQDDINSIENNTVWYDASSGPSSACSSDTTTTTNVILNAAAISNAKSIIGIAKTDNLGQQGALIGLMTGIDESGLQVDANSNVPLSLNVPHTNVGSNGDSLGIFQQQPQFNWSTVASGPGALTNQAAITQLMDPAYSAEAFFGSPPGSGAPSALSKGLQNKSGWQTMTPWMAAQAVQISGTPDGSNYKAKMPEAQSVLSQYWDSALAVPLPVAFSGPGVAPSLPGSTYACAPALGNGTGRFTDNTGIVLPGVDNMLSRAKELSDPNSVLFKDVCITSPRKPKGYANCNNLCEYVAWQTWSQAWRGYPTAHDHWLAMLASGGAHPGDRNLPVGALLFYDSGVSAGHIAVYLGNNEVLSSDIGDSKSGMLGGIYIVSASDLETGTWHAKYLGWAAP